MEALILADRLKAGPFDPEGFRAKLASERERLAGLFAPKADQAVTDAARREHFTAATWVLAVVDREDCSVWPRMGQKPWAEGLLPKVAAASPTKAGAEDKLWQMATTIRLAFADLPLIVFRRRAVAQVPPVADLARTVRSTRTGEDSPARPSLVQQNSHERQSLCNTM
jgi:hypothetical protein